MTPRPRSGRMRCCRGGRRLSNKFGIPDQVERRLRARDTRCVYCGKPFSTDSRGTTASIEHLDERPPFHWKDGLREEAFAICCVSCNSSRGTKTLEDWFQTASCRALRINADTVAEPVKIYLRTRDEVRAKQEARRAGLPEEK